MTTPTPPPPLDIPALRRLLADVAELLGEVRPRDCGAHYCRYCPAKSPEWAHDRHCSYVESQQAAERARVARAALVNAADALLTAAEAGREAVERYGVHDVNCNANTYEINGDAKRCSCGLDDVSARLAQGEVGGLQRVCEEWRNKHDAVASRASMLAEALEAAEAKLAEVERTCCYGHHLFVNEMNPPHDEVCALCQAEISHAATIAKLTAAEAREAGLLSRLREVVLRPLMTTEARQLRRDIDAALKEPQPSPTPEGICELCGHPMPPGEEVFKFHGYSGPCPEPKP